MVFNAKGRSSASEQAPQARSIKAAIGVRIRIIQRWICLFPAPLKLSNLLGIQKQRTGRRACSREREKPHVKGNDQLFL